MTRFLAAAALWLAAFSVHAIEPILTEISRPVLGVYGGPAQLGYTFDSPAASGQVACQATATLYQHEVESLDQTPDKYNCVTRQTGNPSAQLTVFWKKYGQCPANASSSTPYTCTVPACPSGSTMQGNTCVADQTCGAGQFWDGSAGRCRCDSGSDVGDDGQCCPQPGEKLATMQHCYVSDASSSSCTTSAANGCTIRCNDVTFQKPKGGDQVVIGPFLALGQMCKYTGSYSPQDYGGGSLSDDELRDINNRVKNPGDPATPSSCLGQGMGYVTGSGGTTCVASGKGGDVTKNTSTKTDDGKGNSSDTTTKTTTGGDGSSTTTKTTTTHNADGTTTTTTTTTSHNPDGSITETVKTETKDANGNKTGETNSKQETSDKGAWCSAHPDDPACKVEDCPEGSDKASCLRLGDPDAITPVDVPTREGGISSISPVGIASSASCPQGPPLPFGIGYMPLDGICDVASGIRPVLIALAWISAGLIVIGGFKET